MTEIDKKIKSKSDMERYFFIKNADNKLVYACVAE